MGKAAAAFVVVIAAVAPALAGEQATLILKSGERVSGELIDHNASGFQMRVGGADRNIPTNDVATVEFAAA